MNQLDPLLCRRQVFSRHIFCTAYDRSDGMWDVEATLVDTKPHGVVLPERGEIRAGEAIHELVLRVTIDGTLSIQDAAASTLNGPYRICSEINKSYRQLIGMQIGPGFVASCRRLFRGPAGCSHMTELLPSIATTALQVLWGPPVRNESGDWSFEHKGTDSSPSPIDGCHALRRDGEIISRFYPALFKEE